jgi:hypothetical protein
VAAASLAFFGAVILAILIWQLLVQRVATSDLGALLFKLDVGCIGWGHALFIII